MLWFAGFKSPAKFLEVEFFVCVSGFLYHESGPRLDLQMGKCTAYNLSRSQYNRRMGYTWRYQSLDHREVSYTSGSTFFLLYQWQDLFLQWKLKLESASSNL